MTAVESSSPPPHHAEVEKAVIAEMLAEPKRIGEVIGTMLEPGHFYTPAGQVIFSVLYERYYADDPMDPLSVGEACARRLSRAWKVTEDEAIVRVQGLASSQRWSSGDLLHHASLVKRDADYRELQSVAQSILAAVAQAEKTPEEIASLTSQEALQLATVQKHKEELLSYGDAGREFLVELNRVMEARKKGIELGAKFDLTFIDNFTYGLQPTELLIAAGEPGVGKSIVWGLAAQQFAEKQYKLPPDKRVGTLICSLEMGRWPSFIRLAQMATGVPGRHMRTGEIDPNDFQLIRREWGKRKDLPLWFNFASNMRMSQLRALIVESIRRYNVGLVVIDHMRMIDTDHYIKDVNERDEAKVRFLKESLAEDLNVAVICLAHSVKMAGAEDKRPQMGHLRGSGQIAAHADFVNFIYRPYEYASDKAKTAQQVLPTDAEMLWRKNRHEKHGTAEFYFAPDTMTIY